MAADKEEGFIWILEKGKEAMKQLKVSYEEVQEVRNEGTIRSIHQSDPRHENKVIS